MSPVLISDRPVASSSYLKVLVIHQGTFGGEEFHGSQQMG